MLPPVVTQAGHEIHENCLGATGATGVDQMKDTLALRHIISSGQSSRSALENSPANENLRG
jgi:hypothetical protein